jgi:hypothetical protein
MLSNTSIILLQQYRYLWLEMTDTLPTVWRADAHTFAKHDILRQFLGAWFPILSRQAANLGRSQRNVLYVDGFAGPVSTRMGNQAVRLLPSMWH